jgi:hypothetical protein
VAVEEDVDQDRESPPKTAGSSSGWGEGGRGHPYPCSGSVGEDGGGGKGAEDEWQGGGDSARELFGGEKGNVLAVVMVEAVRKLMSNFPKATPFSLYGQARQDNLLRVYKMLTATVSEAASKAKEHESATSFSFFFF